MRGGKLSVTRGPGRRLPSPGPVAGGRGAPLQVPRPRHTGGRGRDPTQPGRAGHRLRPLVPGLVSLRVLPGSAAHGQVRGLHVSRVEATPRQRRRTQAGPSRKGAHRDPPLQKGGALGLTSPEAGSAGSRPSRSGVHWGRPLHKVARRHRALQEGEDAEPAQPLPARARRAPPPARPRGRTRAPGVAPAGPAHVLAPGPSRRARETEGGERGPGRAGDLQPPRTAPARVIVLNSNAVLRVISRVYLS